MYEVYGEFEEVWRVIWDSKLVLIKWCSSLEFPKAHHEEGKDEEERVHDADEDEWWVSADAVEHLPADEGENESADLAGKGKAPHHCASDVAWHAAEEKYFNADSLENGEDNQHDTYSYGHERFRVRDEHESVTACRSQSDWDWYDNARR